MMPVGVVIVDFDGTLVESVGIKDRAFRGLFASDYPAHIDVIMDYHLANNATVRFDKFRHVIEVIVGEVYTEERAAQLAARFSELVASEIIACPPVEGLNAFLDTLVGKLPLYLASVTPDEELLSILEARGLARRMTGIYGASWSKVDAICDVLARERLAPSDAIFVGDTVEDQKSATRAGVAFIGRDSGKPFGPDVTIYPDLRGVLGEIISRVGAQG